jgi:pSer/pThr/pTyr-binding forkhead associated (FHA) protein
MVHLSILTGKQAGNHAIVRRFPFRVGRAAGNDLRLDDDGVWDSHLTLELQDRESFVVHTAAGALLAVNLQPLETATLRNGDLISVGSVKLQFWLAATTQGGLKLREAFVWGLLVAVTLTQLFLIYWLVRQSD